MKLAENVNLRMDKCEAINNMRGRKVHVKEVKHALKVFGGPIGIRIKVSRKAKIVDALNNFEISGFYMLEKVKRPITLIFHLDPAHDCLDFTDPFHFDEFRFVVSQIVQHEMVHMYQFTKNPNGAARYFKVSYDRKLSKQREDEIEYLSDYDEVDAYAHDIAMEIVYRYPNYEPRDILRTIDRRRKLPSYKVYKKAFRGTKWDKLRKMLLKKTEKWLDSVETPALTSI